MARAHHRFFERLGVPLHGHFSESVRASIRSGIESERLKPKEAKQFFATYKGYWDKARRRGADKAELVKKVHGLEAEAGEHPRQLLQRLTGRLWYAFDSGLPTKKPANTKPARVQEKKKTAPVKPASTPRRTQGEVIGVNHVWNSSHRAYAENRIRALPPGSKVALELTPIHSRVDRIIQDLNDKHFFLHLQRVCHELGHTVVPLDDDQLQEQQGFHLNKMNAMIRDTLFLRRRFNREEATARSVHSERVAALRSKHMLQTLLRERPALTIVGAQHAEDFQRAGHAATFHFPEENGFLMGIATRLLSFFERRFPNKPEVRMAREEIIQEMKKLVRRK
ncbi:hypothetical protein HYV43_03195 [Candidatus Micrarchaeota archaeon]|nr:hypothetical protein [Candidatus Micrarchaeota archaeon]